MEDLYPGQAFEYNFRPNWLRNKLTGYNLELDIYLPDLKLGFEFNGKQHDETDQRKRDGIKKAL